MAEVLKMFINGEWCNSSSGEIFKILNPESGEVYAVVPRATVEDVKLMRKVVGPEMGIKAAGGIRDYQKALKLLEAGACSLGMSDSCRIGASSSIAIVSEQGNQ